MEIKFIVNEKSYSTLCKTVKSADLFSVEVSDNHGYNAYVVVNRNKHMIYLTNINNMVCHREQHFPECVKTEKIFKIFLKNFFVDIIRDLDNDFFPIEDENVLFHLYKVFSKYFESRHSSEMEEKHISSASSLSVYSEKGVTTKGFADRIEVELNFKSIPMFNDFIFSHDLGYIRYADKKWTFSADEKLLNCEILHKLIELYDNGITPDKIWLKGRTFTPIEFLDFLYMKELYNIFNHFCTFERGFYHIYHGYVYKRLLIDTNKSNIFNKWQYIAPISKSTFSEGVKWICDDPSSDEERYTKAIALTPGGIIKITAVHSATGYKYFDENGKNFSGAYFKRKAVTEKEKLFADEKGELSFFCKIILSSKDRI